MKPTTRLSLVLPRPCLKYHLEPSSRQCQTQMKSQSSMLKAGRAVGKITKAIAKIVDKLKLKLKPKSRKDVLPSCMAESLMCGYPCGSLPRIEVFNVDDDAFTFFTQTSSRTSNTTSSLRINSDDVHSTRFGLHHGYRALCRYLGL
jgi:hypothetical protein